MNLMLFLAVVGSSQDSVRTVLERDFLFVYDLEELEDPVDGIKVYDQYCPGLAGEINLRIDIHNHVAHQEQVDYYGNGKVLHKGFYEDGALVKFKNYYPNDQIERELRIKKGKPKELLCYYIFGEIRERRVFDDGILMLHEKYNYSGRLSYLMELTEVGYLNIEQWNDADGMPLKYVELKDMDSLIYEILENYSSGTIKEKGLYIYDPKTDCFTKYGRHVKYSETGALMAEIIYKEDLEEEVIFNEKTTTELNVENKMSSMPVAYIAFDLDSNGEITTSEIDEAVNAFFDDDSSMELYQLSGLVNYFFEQDW